MILPFLSLSHHSWAPSSARTCHCPPRSSRGFAGVSPPMASPDLLESQASTHSVLQLSCCPNQRHVGDQVQMPAWDASTAHSGPHLCADPEETLPRFHLYFFGLFLTASLFFSPSHLGIICHSEGKVPVTMYHMNGPGRVFPLKGCRPGLYYLCVSQHSVL